LLQKVTKYLFILSIFFDNVTNILSIILNYTVVAFYIYIFSTNTHISDIV